MVEKTGIKASTFGLYLVLIILHASLSAMAVFGTLSFGMEIAEAGMAEPFRYRLLVGSAAVLGFPMWLVYYALDFRPNAYSAGLYLLILANSSVVIGLLMACISLVRRVRRDTSYFDADRP